MESKLDTTEMISPSSYGSVNINNITKGDKIKEKINSQLRFSQFSNRRSETFKVNLDLQFESAV